MGHKGLQRYLSQVSKCVRDLAEVIFIERVTAPALAVVLPVLSPKLMMKVQFEMDVFICNWSFCLASPQIKLLECLPNIHIHR